MFLDCWWCNLNRSILTSEYDLVVVIFAIKANPNQDEQDQTFPLCLKEASLIWWNIRLHSFWRYCDTFIKFLLPIWNLWKQILNPCLQIFNSIGTIMQLKHYVNWTILSAHCCWTYRHSNSLHYFRWKVWSWLEQWVLLSNHANTNQ